MKLNASLLLLFSVTQTLIADQHHTVRLKDPRHWTTPTTKSLLFSPDGKELTVATSLGLQFIRTRDGEVTGRTRFAPFSMAYSQDGTRLYGIAPRQRKLFRVSDKFSLPMNYHQEEGYIGIRISEQNGKLIISHIDPGSPAAKSQQLKVGAELVGVGQGKFDKISSTVGRTSRNVVRMLKGLPGTFAQLSIIPRGKLDAVVVTVQRAAAESVAGRRDYRDFQVPTNHDNVAWCIGDGYHEFRSASSGRTVSAFRAENLKGNAGTPAISSDSRFFAWVAEYRLVPEAAKQLRDKSRIDSSSVTRRSRSEGSLLKQAAYDNSGFSRTRADYYGVEIYEIATRKLVASFPIAVDPKFTSGLIFRGVQFSDDSNQLIVATHSRLHIYDIQSGKRTNEIVLDPKASRPTVFSLAVANGHAAVGDAAGTVRIISLETGKAMNQIDSRTTAWVSHVALSKDATNLAFHVNGVVHVVVFGDDAALKFSLNENE